MSVGFSLHIGLNKIDANHYAGDAGRLTGSEFDAIAMQTIAKSMGFTDKLLLTEEASRNRAIFLIKDAAEKLFAGDLFFISFSGHGGLLPNLNSDPEPVGYDQSWCLFDAQLMDDELKRFWSNFRRGVKVLVVTDSCFSGSLLSFLSAPSTDSKILPSAVLKETYLRNQTFYDDILRVPNVSDNQILSSILLLASCQDNQESLDGPFNSVFTEQLLKVWDNGLFTGSYRDFLNEIARNTPITQIPQLKTLGLPDAIFLNNKPFKI